MKGSGHYQVRSAKKKRAHHEKKTVCCVRVLGTGEKPVSVGNTDDTKAHNTIASPTERTRIKGEGVS